MDLLISMTLAALVVLLVVGAPSLARKRRKSTPIPSPIALDEVASPPEVKDWIVAFVWAKSHATGEELKALGHELAAWMPRHPLVTRLEGLDLLLAGRYPHPDGPTPYAESPDGEMMPVPRRQGGEIGIEFRRMSVVDPWLHCPALVWVREGMGSDQAIGSLRQSIPPELISKIGYSFM